eukprot:4077692-Alexandrium_andersonii.AAC.1
MAYCIGAPLASADFGGGHLTTGSWAERAPGEVVGPREPAMSPALRSSVAGPMSCSRQGSLAVPGTLPALTFARCRITGH